MSLSELTELIRWGWAHDRGGLVATLMIFALIGAAYGVL